MNYIIEDWMLLLGVMISGIFLIAHNIMASTAWV
jgi:hypothetical protein